MRMDTNSALNASLADPRPIINHKHSPWRQHGASKWGKLNNEFAPNVLSYNKQPSSGHLLQGCKTTLISRLLTSKVPSTSCADRRKCSCKHSHLLMTTCPVLDIQVDHPATLHTQACAHQQGRGTTALTQTLSARRDYIALPAELVQGIYHTGHLAGFTMQSVQGSLGTSTRGSST